MSNYTQITNFTAKDSLASGNAAKKVKGLDVVLPHELWAWLWLEYPSQAMTTFVGNTSDLVELWKMTLEHNPKKLEHHPALDLIKSKPESCIPIRVWGDDAPLGKRGKKSIRKWYPQQVESGPAREGTRVPRQSQCACMS